MNALIERTGDTARDCGEVLASVLREHGERDMVLSAADVTDIRAAAGELQGVLDATDPDTAARLLNGILARTASVPQLSDHDEAPWHLHLTPPDAGPGQWLLATGALALADLLSRRGRPAWGRCAACPRYFVHDGRGTARRFCSSRCATRARVAAHRSRARRERGEAPDGRSG